MPHKQSIRLSLLCALLIIAQCAVAQKNRTVRVTGTYSYYAPGDMSYNEALNEALRFAKINALENGFGTNISQMTVSSVSNDSDSFNAYNTGNVKGEWIETIGEPEFERSFYDNGICIKCTVNGLARELDGSHTDLDVHVLRNGIDLKFEDDGFKTGNNLYLSFKSPINGYVAVFLDDLTNVACLLPYKRDEGKAVPIRHNQQYIFFNRSVDPNPHVDEYQMSCSGDQEINNVIVVFSKNEFSIAITDRSGSKVSVPTVSCEKFYSWVQKCRAQDKDFQVEEYKIVISK